MVTVKPRHCLHCGTDSVFPTLGSSYENKLMAGLFMCLSCRCRWLTEDLNIVWERGEECPSNRAA